MLPWTFELNFLDYWNSNLLEFNFFLGNVHLASSLVINSICHDFGWTELRW